MVLLLIGASPVLAQQAQAGQQVYVVQPGDTLSAIAERFGTTVAEIAQANGIVDPTLIVPGQELVIPGRETQPAPETPGVYVVQPGDTLTTIAGRFGTTVEAIAEANGLPDAALIVAGQRLVIPGHEPAAPPAPPPTLLRYHRVAAGETLAFLSFRYGTTPWALSVANGLRPYGLLRAGRDLQIPPPVSPSLGPGQPRELRTSPAPLFQGQTLLLAVAGPPGLDLTGRFLDQNLAFHVGDEGYWALAGVDVLTPPGASPLTIEAVEAGTGDRLVAETSLFVEEGDFGRYNVVVPADRTGLLDPALSRAERQKVASVFALASDLRQWSGPFLPPLAVPLSTSAGFGQQRSYNGGPVSSYHSGEDYDVDAGTPVYAPAAATVVLAEALQVRGNAVILDHGLGVLTGYWHLDRIDVEVGQGVQPGQAIGLAGNTGLSTGAHLHWELRVHGVPVDPEQWLRKEFPGALQGGP